jgi:hypothetical protein
MVLSGSRINNHESKLAIYSIEGPNMMLAGSPSSMGAERREVLRLISRVHQTSLSTSCLELQSGPGNLTLTRAHEDIHGTRRRLELRDTADTEANHDAKNGSEGPFSWITSDLAHVVKIATLILRRLCVATSPAAMSECFGSCSADVVAAT